MSSSLDASQSRNSPSANSRKRKAAGDESLVDRPRACTECRVAKVRCDNDGTLNTTCSRCQRLALTCEYKEKKRGRKPIVRTRPEDAPDQPGPSVHTPPLSLGLSAATSNSTGRSSPFANTSGPVPAGINPRLSSSSRTFPDSLLNSDSSAAAEAPTSAYSLANLLAPAPPEQPLEPPVPAREEPSDTYQDVVQLGIVPEKVVGELFARFHEILNPCIAILDEHLHTPPYVRSRSGLLFNAILTVSSRFFLPSSYGPSLALSNRQLGEAFSDGLCSLEYIQSLALLTFWKESEDDTSFRRVGLALRMAYELNLHERPRGGRMEREGEREARERLNRERTWFQLLCYDLTMAKQRRKPRMIPEEYMYNCDLWQQDHLPLTCAADHMLVAALSMSRINALLDRLRTALQATSTPFSLEPLLEQARLLLQDWKARWIDRRGPAADPTHALLQYYIRATSLDVAELELGFVIERCRTAASLPGGASQAGAPDARLALNKCINKALDLLGYVVDEHGLKNYLPYNQDIIPLGAARTASWLLKHLGDMDPSTAQMTLDAFHGVVHACQGVMLHERDTPAYCARFFQSLVNLTVARLSISSSSVADEDSEPSPSEPPHVPLPDASAASMRGHPPSLAPRPVSQPGPSFGVPGQVLPPHGPIPAAPDQHYWASVFPDLDQWWDSFTNGDLGLGLGYTR